MARTDILDTLTDIKIQNFAHFKLHKSLVSLIKGPFTWWKEDPSTKKIREGEKPFCLLCMQKFRPKLLPSGEGKKNNCRP